MSYILLKSCRCWEWHKY